jgi:hypothetical protein
VSSSKHNFNGGFAVVHAQSIDAGGAPSVNEFYAYAALSNPRTIDAVSGDAFISNAYRIPLIPFSSATRESGIL